MTPVWIEGVFLAVSFYNAPIGKWLKLSSLRRARLRPSRAVLIDASATVDSAVMSYTPGGPAQDWWVLV